MANRNGRSGEQTPHVFSADPSRLIGAFGQAKKATAELKKQLKSAQDAVAEVARD